MKYIVSGIMFIIFASSDLTILNGKNKSKFKRKNICSFLLHRIKCFIVAETLIER